MKFFNLMRGIFSKPAETPAPVPTAPAQSPRVRRIAAMPPPTAPARALAIAPKPVVSVSTGENIIQIPLAVLVSSFPVELQQRIRVDAIGETMVVFPIDKILTQMGQGLVRAAFGEIRQAAPQAFLGGADKDVVMVTLPLGELVSRLSPVLLARRGQKTIELPSEIQSPFSANGEGLAFGSASPTPISPRGVHPIAPIPPPVALRARGNVSPVQSPVPPGAVAPAPMPVRAPMTTPPGNGSSLPPIKPPLGKPAIGAAPAHANPSSFGTEIISRATNGTNGNGNGNGHANGNGNVSHSPAAPAAAPRPPEVGVLWVALAELMEHWPEGLQLEIAQSDLTDARLALPLDQVEAGLKRGKVSFTWKQLRSWLKPAVTAGISAHDGLLVDLPLGTLAPAFMARQKEQGGGRKQTVVDERIPNLFFGFPQPELPAPAAPVTPAAPVAPAAPVKLAAPAPDTNYFIWDDDNEVAHLQGATDDAPARPAPSPGTNFLSRKATPVEVVARAATLEGVYGALVALQDGLPVAAKLDPSVNGDAIAALIPQMYSKLSGCTKELRMGELNNLNFTVGKVPWKIFRVNGIFFAVHGTVGEPLPTAQLAALAAELDYKKAQ